MVLEPGALEPPDEVRELLEARWPVRAEALARTFGRYIHLLLDANRIHNLTGDREPEKQWTRHIEDTLRAASLIEKRLGAPGPGARILEVGAGGGVPGLILAALWPRAEVWLMDSVEKKVRFLESTARALKLLNVHVLHARSESAGHDPKLRESFDWVVSRAVAALPTLAELTVPFAKWSGEIISIKGPRIDEELAAARRAYELLGVPRPPAVEATTRSDGAVSHILFHHKVGLTPSPYPRRPEVIRDKPL